MRSTAGSAGIEDIGKPLSDIRRHGSVYNFDYNRAPFHSTPDSRIGGRMEPTFSVFVIQFCPINDGLVASIIAIAPKPLTTRRN